MSSPLLVASVLFAVAPAEDEPRSLVVEVVDGTGADCMTPDALHELIADTLDRPIILPDPNRSPHATARVGTRMGERGREATITAIDATGTKMERRLTLEDSRCRELLDSVALVTGLLLDELWQERRVLVVPPPPPPEPEPEPRAEPETPPEPAGEDWNAFVGAGLLASYRDLPGPSAGPSLRVEFASPRVIDFGLLAVGWPRARTGVAGGGAARFAAFDVGVFVCPRILDRARVVLLGCVGGRGGLVSAVGEDLAVPGGATRPRVLVDAGLATRLRLGGPLWLRLSIDASVPVVRDRFEVLGPSGDAMLVHRSWPVLPTAGLGFEIRATVPRRTGTEEAGQKK